MVIIIVIKMIKCSKDSDTRINEYYIHNAFLFAKCMINYVGRQKLPAVCCNTLYVKRECV